MISVAFVCLGNICRSPMAEMVFKNMVREEELAPCFGITSFGTSDGEEGSPIYPPAKRMLIMHGIAGNHTARQLSLKDVVNSDYILVMDSGNLMDVLRLTGGQFGEKIFKLLSFTGKAEDVEDPYFTRDFERAYADIERGCRAFLDYLLKNNSNLIAYEKKLRY